MAKRHLDEVDNYDYLASNSNLPEVVVTAKAPKSFARLVPFDYQPNYGTVSKDDRSWQRRVTDNIVGYLKNNKTSPLVIYPTIAGGVAALMNPLQTIGGLLLGEGGAKASDYLSKKVNNKTVAQNIASALDINEDAAEFLNPIRNIGAVKGSIIGNNIKNRNKFFYMYNPPVGYTSPLQRLKYVGGKILSENKVSNTNEYPFWYEARYKPGQKGAPLRYRDAAYREYLGLGQREPIYIKNADGTYSYNVPYLKQVNNIVDFPLRPEESVDWVTSNGGNLSANSKIIDLGYGISSDSNKRFAIHQMKDVWDLHPFSREPDKLSNRILKDIHKKSDKLYQSIYKPFYDGWTKFGRFGYNNLGGKQLNRLRYGQYDEAIKNNKLVQYLDDKVANFEIGPIMGGKPFTLDTEVPFTVITILDSENPSSFSKNVQLGLNADNILPQAYFDYIKTHGKNFKSGGSIHINPENRGKFNATKERTGKTTEELTHSKNPLTRKRAIFAQNAAKWKH